MFWKSGDYQSFYVFWYIIPKLWRGDSESSRSIRLQIIAGRDKTERCRWAEGSWRTVETFIYEGDKSLNFMRSLIGNQCFTYCSFLTAYFGRLYRRELQWSSLDEIKACTSVLAVSVDINFLIRDRLRRWYNADLHVHTVIICGSIDMVLSKVIPIFLTPRYTLSKKKIYTIHGLRLTF